MLYSRGPTDGEVEEHHRHQELQRGGGGIEADDHDVLHALGVHRHQVDDLTHTGLLPGHAAHRHRLHTQGGGGGGGEGEGGGERKEDKKE